MTIGLTFTGVLNTDKDTSMSDELVRFNLAGAHRYTAQAAAIVPTGSGDGRIIPRLLVATDDPSARTLAITLSRQALAGVIKTAALAEQASASGEIHDIAAKLDLKIAMDEIDGIGESD